MRIHYWLSLILITLMAWPVTPVSAQKTEYQVDTDAKNKVTFISDAPVEDFEGVTGNIDGYLLHTGDKLSEGSKLYFEVDLRTLDTGIGLRNRHMREDYLHTDKYPYAKFSGRVDKTWKGANGPEARVVGKMEIHGKKKELSLKGVLTPSDEGMRVRSTFEVKLTDHGIEVPQFMFMKISEVMKLVLDFQLKRVKG